MTILSQLKAAAGAALSQLYPDQAFPPESITVSQTKPDFEGDYTLVLFPFVKALRQKPDAIGQAMGAYLVAHAGLFSQFSIVSGFLNLTVKEGIWTKFLAEEFHNQRYGDAPNHDHRVMVEYSSPNTNKPLHFGHLRNNFLGWAMAEILRSQGHQVVKANLINDRGIHICKSMIAWQRYAEGATPESSGEKGDHLVGEYYVRFNTELTAEYSDLRGAIDQGDYSGVPEEKAERIKAMAAQLTSPEIQADREKHKKLQDDLKTLIQSATPIMREAQEMLRQWEAGDTATYALWARMNGWVYEGFDKTYARLGLDFDQRYYESDTYLLGKDIVMKGLERGALYQKEDGSIWIDLSAEGLDHKLLLRADGTSVYMTQDLGTAVLKYQGYNLDRSIYVIADEQDYHMQVLKRVLEKLGEPAAKGIHHLSYGMVELPSGKMKSREGTVVDADDMVDEMIGIAQEQTEAAGKTEGFAQDELTALYETIGLGALKFYLLRVDPKKKMVFDPKESIDLHGFTATFIQYAHARMCSILRRENVPLKPGPTAFQNLTFGEPLLPAETAMLRALEQYPEETRAAAQAYNPSLLAQYAFNTAQLFNSFYDQCSVARAESEEKKQLRLLIIVLTGSVLRHAMGLLGIRLPEKM